MKMADDNVDFGTLGGALGTMEEGGKLPFSWMHYRYQLPKLGGVFLWTGFDYRGEPFPWYWPSKSSQYGALRPMRISKGRLLLLEKRFGQKNR